MVQKQVSDMITGVWRIKWWKYRYFLIAGLLLNILLINRFFFDQSLSDLYPFRSSPTDIELEKNPSAPSKDQSLPPHPPSPSQTFNLNDYDFNGDYVGWPLERACNETQWTPGLVYVCDNNSGGIGNIRNFILSCVRYGIETGATGIVMPRIQRRHEEDLANLFNAGFKPFEYFFDGEHFRKAMGDHCPQMKIYNELEDVPNADKMLKIDEFYPKDLSDGDCCDGRGANKHLDMYRSKFENWLNTTRRTPSAAEPVSVRYRWAMFFEWPIYRDGPEFAATFGDILRLNSEVEGLAIKVLDELSKFAGIDPDPSHKELKVPFLGVHLRTESDALGFWPDFTVQTDGYMKEAEARGLKHAYLACGNATDGHRFGEMAYEKLKLNTTSKLDLLKGDDLKRVDHPFDTAFVAYPDGRAALSPNGQIETIPEAERFVDVRVRDLKGVLDALGGNKTFAKQVPGIHGVLDVKSVGVFGHSLGGAASASLMLTDPRATCGANLDGLLVGPVVASGLPKGKEFLIVGAVGHNSSNDQSWSSFLNSTTGRKVELSVNGATHSSFNDFGYLYELGRKFGVIPDLGGSPFGTIDADRMLKLLDIWLGAWFDKCLRNQNDEGIFVGGSMVWPEVEVISGLGK
ncbi:putative platelet-activating factor acetylhydrolase [Tricladium varicosporioides]|nr:putative platelet-activating factor acetylhydrolase [Hymenoscyphus varicosporioides]